MTVRAKLYVSSVQRQASTPDSVAITLAAVTRGEDNRTWAQATPSASFSMTIQNPKASVEFELGQEFYVDFTPVGQASTLRDGHIYKPSSYQQDLIDKNDSRANETTWRCAECNASKPSHEEPLRSLLAEWRP